MFDETQIHVLLLRDGHIPRHQEVQKKGGSRVGDRNGGTIQSKLDLGGGRAIDTRMTVGNACFKVSTWMTG